MTALTPTIAYQSPTGPGRIHIQPGLIAHMEPALDAAIAQARAAGGVGIAIEVMEGARVVVRMVIGNHLKTIPINAIPHENAKKELAL